MNIEVGKFYKTRGGDKVRIYAVDGGARYTIHGAALENNIWLAHSWTITGANCYGGCESAVDIASEWEEPKPRMLGWRRTSGLGIFVSYTAVQETKPNDGFSWTRAPWLDEPE